jgi:hypothetical protein
MINGFLTDDFDISHNSIDVFRGGNGDIYIEVTERDTNDHIYGRHAVRIAFSGGNYPTEVKKAAVALLNAIENHRDGLENGRYYEFKHQNSKQV